jgi:hypothetical protein
MELRKCEETINELASFYESIRQSCVLILMKQQQEEVSLPTIPEPEAEAGEGSLGVEGDETPASAATQNSSANSVQIITPITPINDLQTLVETIQKIQQKLTEQQSIIQKFTKRLSEMDPVTEKPRYGPKAQVRVRRTVQIYNFLSQQVPVAVVDNDSNDCNPTSSQILLLQNIMNQYQQEQERHREQQSSLEQQKLEEEMKQQQELEERERLRKSEEEQRRLWEETQKEEEGLRIRQQAEQVRRQRLLEEQRRRDAERQYLDSIQKGTEGVRYYLQQIKDSTSASEQERTTCLESLYTIFDQINRHPEEPNHRRIRLNHPRFHQDIGKHPGGIELLIASGFRPTKMSPMTEETTTSDGDGITSTHSQGVDNDDESNTTTIECLVSREPNLETDMDGWTEWYDLNKATFETLQKEVGARGKIR